MMHAISSGQDTRRFGLFEIDLRAGELRRQGIKVKLQEQPFQILARLLETPGDVVTREELRQRLWPSDTFVDFDHSLNAAVRRLRDALGDSAENPRFVETVARRGYRFLAPVSVGTDGNGVQEAPLSPASSTFRTQPHYWWIAGGVSAAILLVVGLLVGLSMARHDSVPPRITRITANPVDDPVRAAAVSPDGRYLSYADDNGFYLRQIDTGETHPLSLPDGFLASAISWFPDSVHMVVSLRSTNRDWSLWEFSALGGSARRLIDDGRNPAVSPDGNTIAFIAGTWAHQKIWLASRTGEERRALAGEDGDLFGTVTWSPDGRRLAYTTAKATYGYGAKGSIAVVDLSHATSAAEISAPAILLTSPGLEAPIAWAPGGTMIYAQQETRPRQLDSNLWAVRMDGQSRVQGPPQRLSNDTGAVSSVGVSADGKRIVYVKGIPEPDVYVAKLTSSGTIDAEPQRLTLDDRQDLPYDWTLDSKEVIFISDRTGTFDVYKQALGQPVPDLLISGSQPAQIVRLNPDGTQILYEVYPNWGDPNHEVPLMRVPLAGGPPQEVLRAKGITNHQCARAPATVCIYSVATNTDLTFFTFDPIRGPKSRVFQVKDDLSEIYDWSLSPDGATLAISKGKVGGEEPRIHLISLTGAPEKWLTLKGWSGIAAMDWAADSKGIWATTNGERENALLHLDLQGSARAVWSPKNRHVQWAIPSRDGKYLALHVHSVSANAWMLDRP